MKDVIDGKTCDRFITVDGCRLEYQWIGGARPDAPTLVFLHEGLGCVAMWRDFPARVAQLTGLSCLVYSRQGYGKSDPIPAPRPVRYMHHEGLNVLPKVLDLLEITNAILLGHSDGGSIALIHAGSGGAGRVKAVVTIAAHVFIEDICVTSIAKAKVAYETSGLRDKLVKFHGVNVDGAFWGWNEAWLNPEFRHWNIEEFLPDISVPVLAIQGEDDQYGTLAQVDAIEQKTAGPVERLIIPGCHHSPFLEQPDTVAAAIWQFVISLYGDSNHSFL